MFELQEALKKIQKKKCHQKCFKILQIPTHTHTHHRTHTLTSQAKLLLLLFCFCFIQVMQSNAAFYTHTLAGALSLPHTRWHTHTRSKQMFLLFTVTRSFPFSNLVWFFVACGFSCCRLQHEFRGEKRRVLMHHFLLGYCTVIILCNAGKRSDSLSLSLWLWLRLLFALRQPHLALSIRSRAYRHAAGKLQ